VLFRSGNTSTPAAKAVFNTANSTDAGILISNWIGSGTTNGPRLAFDNSTVGTWNIGCGNNTNTFVIRDTGASSDRLTIDSSGSLLVGTSSSSSEAKLLVQGGSTGSGAALHLQRNVTTASAGSTIGYLRFANSADNAGATIVAEGDGTWTAGTSHPTRLVFSTTADGASSPTERMRIGNNGNIGIGAANAGNARFYVVGVDATASNFACLVKNSASTDLFYILNDGTFSTGAAASSPYNNTTATAANTVVTSLGVLQRSTSSIKYKTNVETLQDFYADAVLDIRPVWYQSTCKADNPEWGHWGFIAEEVAQVDPRLCFFKEEEDGTLEPESVQYDRFVPHLLNLIKRQQKAIQTLEAKVAALEGA
jgi:hypothetical protein